MVASNRSRSYTDKLQYDRECIVSCLTDADNTNLFI